MHRAPEADDVMWEHVTMRGTGWLTRAVGRRGWMLGVKGRALRTHLIVATVLVPLAWLIYLLTIAKLVRARIGVRVRVRVRARARIRGQI